MRTSIQRLAFLEKTPHEELAPDHLVDHIIATRRCPQYCGRAPRDPRPSSRAVIPNSASMTVLGSPHEHHLPAHVRARDGPHCEKFVRPGQLS